MAEGLPGLIAKRYQPAAQQTYPRPDGQIRRHRRQEPDSYTDPCSPAMVLLFQALADVTETDADAINERRGVSGSRGDDGQLGETSTYKDASFPASGTQGNCTG